MYFTTDNISSGDCFSELIMVGRDFLELTWALGFFFFPWGLCEPYLTGISNASKVLKVRPLARLDNSWHLAIGTFGLLFNPVSAI